MAVATTAVTWTGTKIANCNDLGTKVLKWARLDIDCNGTATYDWVTGFDYVLFAVVQNTEVHSESPLVVWNKNVAAATANGTVAITAVDGTNNTFHLFAVGF